MSSGPPITDTFSDSTTAAATDMMAMSTSEMEAVIGPLNHLMYSPEMCDDETYHLSIGTLNLLRTGSEPVLSLPVHRPVTYRE
jgi:hypothetical protein